MERQHIVKEISELAERIKTDASGDSVQLLSDAARLYEMAILLKHSSEEVKGNGQSVPGSPAQTSMDLFSTQQATAEVSSRQEPGEQKSVRKKPEESVAEKLNHKKVADLKSVIGINEKFQFINELFDGNMKEYSVAIDQINNFSSLGEAVNYLANLKGMYKWKEDSHIARQFTELVERKFF